MSTIYAAMRRGLHVTDGRPGDWRTRTRFNGQHVECVDVSQDAPATVFCGTFGDGLYRSQDSAETFQRVGVDAFDSDQLTAVAISPHDPDIVWAGTEPSAVYRSADGGDSWEKLPGLTDLPSADDWFFPPRPETHRVRSIEHDLDEPDRTFLGIELGAFVITTDGGHTWSDDVPGARRDTHEMATHPESPNRVYASSGFGYAESSDHGDSWEHPHDGLPEDREHLWSLAVDPGDPDTVIVSTSKDAFTAHFEPAESYAHRLNGDDNWEPIDGRGLPTGEGVFATSFASGYEPGEFYAVNNRGLFRSIDGGDSWTPLDVTWPEIFVEQDPRGLVVVK